MPSPHDHDRMPIYRLAPSIRAYVRAGHALLPLIAAVLGLLPATAARLPGAEIAPGSAPYVLSQTWALGGEGRWDYATCSADGSRLYVTRSSHTQVIDTATGHLAADILGTPSCHGVALAPAAQRGFISSAATVVVVSLTTNQVLGVIPAAADADGIITDAFSQHVLVFCGDAHVAVPISIDVDPVHGHADQPIALGGDPEFAVSDGAGHVYANIKDTAEVVAINTRTWAIDHRFPIELGANPTGLSLDPATRLLFIGCRNRQLVVMNADTGVIVTRIPIGSGVDATAVHAGRAFASCGDGTVSVVRVAPGGITVLPVTATQVGARTMAINPVSGAIYLPTSDFAPADPASDENPHPRPKPLPGTFRILVLTPRPASR